MVLENIKAKSRERGFTIVELLVVIAVIAILAAITIVAYVGVTTRAKTSQSLASATNVQSFAEAYNADNGAYPSSTAALTGGTTSAKLNGGTYTWGTMAGIPSTATTVYYQGYIAGSTSAACTTSNVIGAKITYWDYSQNSVQTVTAGNTSGTTCTSS